MKMKMDEDEHDDVVVVVDDDVGSLWKAYPGLHSLSLRHDHDDDDGGTWAKQEAYDPREDPEKVV